MLRTKIRQTGGITVDKMLNTNHIFKKLKRKKYFAALALVSAAAVVLFRHFQNFDLIVEDEDIGDLPAWWSLSPLWYNFVDLVYLELNVIFNFSVLSQMFS